MEEVFKAKYKNLHITNDLNSINPYELIKGDGIMLLSGNTEVTSVHLKFNGIINNNIIVFNKLNTQADYYKSYSTSTVYYDHDNVDKVYFYYENGHYITTSMVSGYNMNLCQEFHKHLYKIHKNNKKGKVISGKFVDVKTPSEGIKIYNSRESIEIYSYLLFPTGTDDMKVLVNFDLEHDRDYLIYFKPMQSIPAMKYPYYNVDSYKVNMEVIMNILNLEQTKHVQWFNDLIKCKNYRTTQYVEDANRNETLVFVNNFLTENFNRTSHIKLVFENKDVDVKAYVEGNRALISWKDKVRYYNNGRGDNFKTQRFYTNGATLTVDVDPDVKDNLEFQQWYIIAYDITEFYINKRGINPETGDYYIKNGEINNGNILYKDFEGIVARGDHDRNEVYAKLHGYYIKCEDKEEIQEVLDRMQVLENLKNSR